MGAPDLFSHANFWLADKGLVQRAKRRRVWLRIAVGLALVAAVGLAVLVDMLAAGDPMMMPV